MNLHIMVLKSIDVDDIRNQTSIVKNVLKLIRERAKYGTHEKLNERLSKIEKAIINIESKIEHNRRISSFQKYQRILVPYDGSIYSKKALRDAISISKKFGSIIYLITIVDLSEIRSPGTLLGLVRDKKMKKLTNTLLDSVSTKAEQKLQKEIALCNKEEIETHYEVIKGNIADSIIRFSKNNKADLIIMGSHGLAGFKKLFALGSVSRKVSEQALCPVMIIH